jgi:hypothetical protein
MAEVQQLRQELQKERQEREKIVVWIKETLGPNLDQVKKLVGDMIKENASKQAQDNIPTSIIISSC